MPTQTSKGFPYPEAPDPDKPRLDLEALAVFLEQVPGIRVVTTAERDVLVNLWPGMVIFNTTLQRLEVNRSGTAGDWKWVIDAAAPVPIGNGGTGLSVAPSLLVNLGSTVASSPLSSAPRPGVTGTLPIAQGGTGGATAAAARTSLGVESAANIGNPETNFVTAFEAAL
ncbi:hypothetical protein [Microbacterium sp. G2-8]|uniref:hypothetical protein n=1 Tax=Microbacterium sp. G2-8 TaxID=2842454 RepID=UPI001C89107C|nr:hypothetical protein [Microbacterium sp. G2-8]